MNQPQPTPSAIGIFEILNLRLGIGQIPEPERSAELNAVITHLDRVIAGIVLSFGVPTPTSSIIQQ